MNTKSMLTHRIHAYEFAILELELYLDTHENDIKALLRRDAFIKERNALIKEYESKYGEWVVTTKDVRSTKNWSWVNGPWPWEYKEGDL